MSSSGSMAGTGGMRKSMSIAALLFCCALAGLARSVTAIEGGFIRRRGQSFVDEKGNPFFVHGSNFYWLMFQGADLSTRPMVEKVLDDAKTLGLNVGRTWAFNDGGERALQTYPGLYDESVFQSLDYAVATAGQKGIRLVMSFVNNYPSYGGKPQYVAWARGQGLYLPNDDLFFTHPTLRTWYKNHILKVLNRKNTITGVLYKDDPAIFSWELMNEPHCESDPSGDTLAQWVKEMAAYVKSIDSKHLLEIGLEGFYGASSGYSRQWANPDHSDGDGTDFIRLNKIDHIDYATVHSYPDLWIPNTSSAERLNFLQVWVNLHIKDASQILKMPILFCEFGKNSRSAGYDLHQRQQFFWTVYNSVYSSIASGGAAGGSMLWQLLPDGMQSWDDGFAVYAADQSITSIITTQTRRLRQRMHRGF